MTNFSILLFLIIYVLQLIGMLLIAGKMCFDDDGMVVRTKFG